MRPVNGDISNVDSGQLRKPSEEFGRVLSALCHLRVHRLEELNGSPELLAGRISRCPLALVRHRIALVIIATFLVSPRPDWGNVMRRLGWCIG